MAAGPRGVRDEAAGTLVDRLAGMDEVDHIVKHDASVTPDRIVDFGPRAERGDHDGHFVLDAGGELLVEQRVGLVDDQVDGVGSGRPVRMAPVVVGQRIADTRQPLVQHIDRAGIERRQRSDHAGDALGYDQFGAGHDEHRCTNDRQGQVASVGRP